MWTYLLGPILALFPKAWREALSADAPVNWPAATAISGFVEIVGSVIALMQWYATSMSTWVGNGVSVALSGKMGPEVRVQDIGAAALFVWVTHPVTWSLAYLGIEGAVRLCAGAFGGNACGSLPLFLADQLFVRPFRRSEPKSTDSAAGIARNVSSYAGSIRERIHAATAAELSDELSFSQSEAGETLEIRASRRKQDWTPPRVVQYLDAYYRLEEESRGSGPRPFHYLLRRLPAGVPGRTVLLYAPSDAVVREPVR